MDLHRSLIPDNQLNRFGLDRNWLVNRLPFSLIILLSITSTMIVATGQITNISTRSATFPASSNVWIFVIDMLLKCGEWLLCIGLRWLPKYASAKSAMPWTTANSYCVVLNKNGMIYIPTDVYSGHANTTYKIRMIQFCVHTMKTQFLASSKLKANLKNYQSIKYLLSIKKMSLFNRKGGTHDGALNNYHSTIKTKFHYQLPLNSYFNNCYWHEWVGGWESDKLFLRKKTTIQWIEYCHY